MITQYVVADHFSIVVY